MPVVSPCILVVVLANRANAAKRLVPCGFALVRSGAKRAHAQRIRSSRRRCASRKSSRRAYFRGIRRFRMGHCTRGVLPGQNPIRGATARRFDSVRVRTEVCRVCGLHPGDAGRQTECRASVGISAQWMSATGANLSASPVRRYAPALGHLSDGRRVEVEFTPLGRKTVTPFTTSIGAGFRRYRGRKSAKRPPWNGAEERGIA